MLFNQRMTRKHAMDGGALDTLAATVNKPNFPKSRFVRGMNVFFDHGWDVTRRERVEV